MKILFLTFYFEPDLCAGSFRASAITDALLSASADVEVDILTTKPNRYGSFVANAADSEPRGRVSIYRFALPQHQSGMSDQSRAFLAYAKQVLLHIRGKRYDGVLATSSRLMTATLASLVARVKRVPLYLDIRDIFVDTIGDVLPSRIARVAVGPFGLLERWTMRRASHINLVSEGFRDYFSDRYPGVPLSFFTNGIDDEFLGQDLTAARPANTGAATEVLYAGNVGEGQGLHLIVPKLAARLPSFRFTIIGDGGRINALREEVNRRGLGNVVLVPPVKRAALVAASLQADILFLHLNDHPAFRKVLPSKIFEYGALGKPIWAGVAGYAAEFIRREIDNAEVFQPCDVEDALRALSRLEMKNAPRPLFVERYARRAITRRLADSIMTSLSQAAGPHVQISRRQA